MITCKQLALVCLSTVCCLSLNAKEAVTAQPAAQVLAHDNMKLINSFFGANPRIMISINKAAAVARRTIHELPKILDTDIASRLELVLKPGEFFLTMLDGDAGSFIEPLIIESFGTDGHANSILGAMSKQKSSPLLFFRARIKSKKDLNQFCHEFNKFSQDLHRSLAPEVQKAVADEMKRLIAQSHNQQASR